MNKRYLMLPILAGLVVVGCQSMKGTFVPPGTVFKACNGSCDVEVKVTGNCMDQDQVDTVDGNLEVKQRNTKITWVITTPGYEFAGGNGITIHHGAGQFKSSFNPQQPQKFSVHDKKDVDGDFKYSVRVKPTGSTFSCWEYDPTIRNN